MNYKHTRRISYLPSHDPFVRNKIFRKKQKPFVRCLNLNYKRTRRISHLPPHEELNVERDVGLLKVQLDHMSDYDSHLYLVSIKNTVTKQQRSV